MARLFWMGLLLTALLLAACGNFHEVTFLVESPDASVDTVRMSWGFHSSNSWYTEPVLLPATAVEHIRHVEARLTADTDLDIAGTITATILLDGVPVEAGSVTANGSPASITIVTYIPD